MKYFATVSLLAMFAVALTQAQLFPDSEKRDLLSPVNAEADVKLVHNEKRSTKLETEKVIPNDKLEDQGKSASGLRSKRGGLVYSASPYTAPLTYATYTSPYAYAAPYAAYSSPYAYARSYAYPYVSAHYRSYPYTTYNSPYYF